MPRLSNWILRSSRTTTTARHVDAADECPDNNDDRVDDCGQQCQHTAVCRQLQRHGGEADDTVDCGPNQLAVIPLRLARHTQVTIVQELDLLDTDPTGQRLRISADLALRCSTSIHLRSDSLKSPVSYRMTIPVNVCCMRSSYGVRTKTRPHSNTGARTRPRTLAASGRPFAESARAGLANRHR